LNAKLGRDTDRSPATCAAAGNTGRPVIFIETNDGRRVFPLQRIYPKIVGGEMWVALDPQSPDQAPQEGILNIRDFTVRADGRARSRRRQSARLAGRGISRACGWSSPVRFGRLTIKEGIVRGQVIGATVDGYIDYLRGRRGAMRGTFVPLVLPQQHVRPDPARRALPRRQQRRLAGRHLRGGGGPPNGPILRVNPISAVAPGLLRKVLRVPEWQCPRHAEQTFADPRERN